MRRRCRDRRGRNARSRRNPGAGCAVRSAAAPHDCPRRAQPRRIRSRCDAGSQARHRADRRIRAHQRPRQPPSQALAGCRGAARRWHRRADHAQYTARRKPQRCGGGVYPGAGARDGPRRHSRRCRDRSRRPAARRADRAVEGGQSLCAARSDARAGAFLLEVQPFGLARTGAAPRGASGRPIAARHRRTRWRTWKLGRRRTGRRGGG